MEGSSSISTTFVVEVLDLCPQRIAGVISYNTQYAHDDDDDDDDDSDDDGDSDDGDDDDSDDDDDDDSDDDGDSDDGDDDDSDDDDDGDDHAYYTHHRSMSDEDSYIYTYIQIYLGW